VTIKKERNAEAKTLLGNLVVKTTKFPKTENEAKLGSMPSERE